MLPIYTDDFTLWRHRNDGYTAIDGIACRVVEIIQNHFKTSIYTHATMWTRWWIWDFNVRNDCNTVTNTMQRNDIHGRTTWSTDDTRDNEHNLCWWRQWLQPSIWRDCLKFAQKFRCLPVAHVSDLSMEIANWKLLFMKMTRIEQSNASKSSVTVCRTRLRRSSFSGIHVRKHIKLQFSM